MFVCFNFFIILQKINAMFRKDVAIQAILYVASKVRRKDIHKICKILYFADRDHLSTYGRTITGDVYIAMKYGPVPSNIEDIFKAVRGTSYFSKYADEFSGYFRFKNDYILEPLREPDMDYLSESDVECLDKYILKCGDMPFGELTAMSHDIAWNASEKDRAMSITDILSEAGDSEDYISYIGHKMDLENSFMS